MGEVLDNVDKFSNLLLLLIFAVSTAFSFCIIEEFSGTFLLTIVQLLLFLVGLLCRPLDCKVLLALAPSFSFFVDEVRLEFLNAVKGFAFNGNGEILFLGANFGSFLITANEENLDDFDNTEDTEGFGGRVGFLAGGSFSSFSATNSSEVADSRSALNSTAEIIQLNMK